MRENDQKKKCTTFPAIFPISFQFLFQMMSMDHFQCGNGIPNDRVLYSQLFDKRTFLMNEQLNWPYSKSEPSDSKSSFVYIKKMPNKLFHE